MKPFNLEAAKAGKPIVTRDGRVAKFVAHVPEVDEPRLVVIVGATLKALADNGKAQSIFGDDHPCDLFMAEEEITVYFNEYDDGAFGEVHRSMVDAERFGSPRVVKIHAVQIKV